MSILRKKGRKQKRNHKNSSPLKGKVYMPQKKKQNIIKKKKGVFLLKRTSKNSIKKRRFTKKKKILHSISRLFLYAILPLLFLGLLYISILSVLNMRNREENENVERTYIVGIEDVPAYPGSQFIFQNSIEQPSVANFLGSGNSAYRLPLNDNIVQAYDYYQRILPELGWEHVLSVEVGSEEMKEGEYWVKNNAGLRIYSKFNDLWYEVVTVEEANNGLRARVEREIERDLLLAGEDVQELLPDFPWIIEIPKKYVISYKASSYKDLRSVEFKKIGSNERVTVTPVAAIGGPLDNHLGKYLDLLQESPDTDKQEIWTITNTIIQYTSYATVLTGTISSNSEVHEVAVVPNVYNNVVYIIHSNALDSPFFEYVFSNLLPQGFEKE